MKWRSAGQVGQRLAGAYIARAIRAPVQSVIRFRHGSSPSQAVVFARPKLYVFQRAPHDEARLGRQLVDHRLVLLRVSKERGWIQSAFCSGRLRRSGWDKHHLPDDALIKCGCLLGGSTGGRAKHTRMHPAQQQDSNTTAATWAAPQKKFSQTDACLEVPVQEGTGRRAQPGSNSPATDSNTASKDQDC